MAFLINAYNGFTLKRILSSYRQVKFIKELDSFFSGPWEKKFFILFGTKHHLDYIEHERLRKDFRDPRIHFAIVCAAVSCPPLAADAYTAEHLDQQLQNATQNFLSDRQRNRINADQQQLLLSSLFKWYAEDFIVAAGSVQAFVGPYLASEAGREIEAYSIRYLAYDWSLNSAD